MNQPVTSIFSALALTAAAVLAGCASPPVKGPGSYVVLLPSPDGSVGQVVVQNPHGEQVLTRAQQGLALNGRTPQFAVSDEQLKRDFDAARTARPMLPEQFLLYFERGGSELTPESKALLTHILARALSRSALDMSVIGHTDTLGKADANQALALKRAEAMAMQLRQLGLQNAVMRVESHGERNLLISTPDEVAEPRNRRVEVTLR